MRMSGKWEPVFGIAACRERDIFVTTKLWNADQGYDTALAAFDRSLSDLALGYIDLYLIHWPVPETRLESWKALEKIFSEGRTRAIGVSNFMIKHLEELLAHCDEPPAVNQIEASPFSQQRDVRAFCAANGIVVQAYSQLTRGLRLDHPVVTTIAQSIARTRAQVLLRWGLQSDMVVLPKPVHRERLIENLDLFSFLISPEQMAELDSLEEGLMIGWNPREWE
jgi:diketogulonate reductase-like aldo/keto reductase